jgi:peroxiredoxin
MLGDADSSFSKSIDMILHLPQIGLNNRSKRYALYAVDGVVQVLHHGEESGQCEISGGEAMLAAI